MLYSSTDQTTQNQVIDANSYPPFKLVDSTIVTRIMEELDEPGEQEGIQIHLSRPALRSVYHSPVRVGRRHYKSAML
jgi:hypothetical protein